MSEWYSLGIAVAELDHRIVKVKEFARVSIGEYDRMLLHLQSTRCIQGEIKVPRIVRCGATERAGEGAIEGDLVSAMVAAFGADELEASAVESEGGSRGAVGGEVEGPVRVELSGKVRVTPVSFILDPGRAVGYCDMGRNVRNRNKLMSLPEKDMFPSGGQSLRTGPVRDWHRESVCEPGSSAGFIVGS
jgi:hypothetical protein